MKKTIHTPKEKQAMFRKGVLIVVVLILVLVAVGVASQAVDQRTIAREEETTQWPQDMVEINGVKCTPKKNIKTYLFMGTDSRGEVEEVTDSEKKGQCDTLELLVVDYTTNTYTRLPINRDTMTEVQSLDTDGTYLATTKVQIALAHSKGDGKEISCENALDAVSNLLYGQTIDGYASLNMDAIGVLNHLAGGVTITIEDDFSKSDPSLVQGETVTLTDEQAMAYVHDRMNVGDGTNESRMRRQSQYLSALKPILVEKCQADSNYPLEIYDALTPYMVTDLSRNDFIKLTATLLESEEQERLHIEGTNAIGDTGFNEFTVDEDSLADVVIQLFYDKVEE